MKQPPKPSPFAPDDEWSRFNYARRTAVPGWYADRDFVTSHALDQLPRVSAALDFGPAIAFMQRPKWWHSLAHDPRLAAIAPPNVAARPVIVIRLDTGGYDLVFIDRSTGEWEIPNVVVRGPDLVSLAAWRWNLSPTRAAWRLAKICGLRRPYP